MDNGTSGAARRHPTTLISLIGPKLSRSPLYAAQFQSSCGNGVARHRGGLRPQILHSRSVDIASRPYWIQRKSKSSAGPRSGPISGYVFQLRVRCWVRQTTCSRLFAMDKRSVEHVTSCSRFRLSDVSLDQLRQPINGGGAILGFTIYKNTGQTWTRFTIIEMSYRSL